MTDEDIDQIAEGIEEFIIAGDEALRPIWGQYIEKLFRLKEQRHMGKLSQLDRVLQSIDKDIADLQAMRTRLLLQANKVAPKRVRKPKAQAEPIPMEVRRG